MAIKTETVTIKVSAEEKELIKRIARDKDITVSKLLYKIVIEQIRKESTND